MKQKSVNKFFSFLLVLVLLTPITLQFSHSFENHQINSAKKYGINKSINTINCDVFHHIFTTNTTIQVSNYFIFDEVFQTKIINEFTSVYFKNNQNLIETRGPPFLIL